MKKYYLAILTLLSLFLLASCVDDHKAPEPVSGELEFVLSRGQWLYISLESGEVVGKGKLGDEASDAAWALRDDWDIAICDSLIRTNGGTSGMGRGALSAESTAKTVPDYYQEIW